MVHNIRLETVPVLVQPRHDAVALAAVEIPLDAVYVLAGRHGVGAGQHNLGPGLHNTCNTTLAAKTEWFVHSVE